MNGKILQRVVQDAVDWSLANGLTFKMPFGSSQHVAFNLTPTPMSEEHFNYMRKASGVLAKLISTLSGDIQFLSKAVEPLILSDPLFGALFKGLNEIHCTGAPPLRLPLLIMRSDFMNDISTGVKLVEFNGIAAGMGPFGQRTQELQHYIYDRWSNELVKCSPQSDWETIKNNALEGLSNGVALAVNQIKQEFDDAGSATFLMVVCEHEINVFDQHMLEWELQKRGISTIRRTLDELASGLSSGCNGRLFLDDTTSIDCVYFRSGYQFSDYLKQECSKQEFCDSYLATRIFIEKHRVAVNATISQQLATSKRVQMLLSVMSLNELMQFGLSQWEAKIVKSVMCEAYPVTSQTRTWLSEQSLGDWVLKNQGEGGGHCIFDDDILCKLKSIRAPDQASWMIMKRIKPVHRVPPSLIVRNGEFSTLHNIVGELGIFTIHIDGSSVCNLDGYCGYLLRSKPSAEREGGVHSGKGVLDSLCYVRAS